jgi:hypothetical protein
MTSSVFRYSQRLELLRAARRFGVSRFEANLLIAATLERRRAHASEQGDSMEPTVATQFATFVLIQGATAFAVWWTLFR